MWKPVHINPAFKEVAAIMNGDFSASFCPPIKVPNLINDDGVISFGYNGLSGSQNHPSILECDQLIEKLLPTTDKTLVAVNCKLYLLSTVSYLDSDGGAILYDGRKFIVKKSKSDPNRHDVYYIAESDGRAKPVIPEEIKKTLEFYFLNKASIENYSHEISDKLLTFSLTDSGIQKNLEMAEEEILNIIKSGIYNASSAMFAVNVSIMISAARKYQSSIGDVGQLPESVITASTLKFIRAVERKYCKSKVRKSLIKT